MHLDHRGKKLGLDYGKADVSFLSHAHSDHMKGGMKKQKSVIASSETLALAGLDAEKTGLSDVRMINAGHILGARQIVIEGDGEKTVYTGDISVKENIFGFKADIEECDKLIVESTYASPEYKFRSSFEIYDDISEWVKRNSDSNILIGAYELGKAQEIIRVLNEYCGMAPVVTEKTERFCSIYESFGYKLDRVMVGSNEAEEVMNRPFVAVVPMRLSKRGFAFAIQEAFERRTLFAVATGWALRYNFGADAAFALSDHADFDDLTGYICGTGAKDISFFDGGGEKVAETVRQKTLIRREEMLNHVS